MRRILLCGLLAAVMVSSAQAAFSPEAIAGKCREKGKKLQSLVEKKAHEAPKTASRVSRFCDRVTGKVGGWWSRCKRSINRKIEEISAKDDTLHFLSMKTYKKETNEMADELITKRPRDFSFHARQDLRHPKAPKALEDH